MTQLGRTPDPQLLKEIRDAVTLPKSWGTPGAMRWVDGGGRPRGYKLREGLVVRGVQIAGLFVEAYWKPATLRGVPDKLSLSLFYRGYRIIGVDENGPSRHVNTCGRGRAHFMQRVDHPQLHSVSDDQVYGYAEPLPRVPLPIYWAQFTAACNISGAPSFTLPPEQLGLLP